jgi:hypothetical protein
MSRRFETGRIFHVVADNITTGSGVVQLVAPSTNIIIIPKVAHISSHGGGAFEYQVLAGSGVSGQAIFLHGHVPSNSSDHMTWPNGFELAKGDGAYIEPLANDGTINLYYSIHDESPGTTKIQSRSNSFTNITTTRTPSNVIGQDKS